MKFFSFWAGVFATTLAISFSSPAAPLPSEWRLEQPFEVTAPGVVKLNLPTETLGAACAGLEDLRVFDDAGNEVPYLIDRPVPAGKAIQGAKSFQQTLTGSGTVMTIETGLPQPLDAVTLETPASSFIKAVKVEASADGRAWKTLTEGQPIFRQSYGATQLRISFPATPCVWLRLTVDDRRSGPVPFTGARVHAAETEPVPTESFAATIAERHENPGETRLTLNLGAANLDLASVRIESAEPLFTRQVTVAVPQVTQDTVMEYVVNQGTIYRVAVEGLPASTNLSVPVQSQVRSSQLFLLIKNYDSPPLPITAVRVERRPVYLAFLARQKGTFHLLAGNSACRAPRYDVAALGSDFKRVAVSSIMLPPPVANPSYRPPEVLPGIQQEGTALDVATWKFRKAARLAGSGAQQLELDLDVLAHAQSGFADLRLIRDGKQVPFILERTSITRSITPNVIATNDPKTPTLSRWILKLPMAGLPVTRLDCSTRTTLFHRDVTLSEEVVDDRGETYRRSLAAATWVQTPDRRSSKFVFTFSTPPGTDTLFLETPNGDNPPITLENFQLSYPATRVLFKARQDDTVFLCYGNPEAAAPRYDLSLVAGQLLAADKATAALGPEEQIRKTSWGERHTPGKGGVIFWSILAVVVIGLLAVIARLLPKAPSA